MIYWTIQANNYFSAYGNYRFRCKYYSISLYYIFRILGDRAGPQLCIGMVWQAEKGGYKCLSRVRKKKDG